MPDIDLARISQIIQDVAHDKIVPRFQQLAYNEIHEKSGPGDLVTIADIEAETELTRILPDILPGSVVVGEEAVSKGTVLRDVMKDSSATVWVVDPVDGTNNFASGRPIFGTMVALVSGGERIASWIYQIPKNRMVCCEKGAAVLFDGETFTPPPKPAGDAPFANMRAFISRKFIPPRMRPLVDERIKLMGDVSTFMCCAWEYVEVLEGNSVFSLYKRIEPWDHLAGVLLLEEAGHYIRKWDKTHYLASDLEGGLINAPSKEIWERVHQTFLEEALIEAKQNVNRP